MRKQIDFSPYRWVEVKEVQEDGSLRCDLYGCEEEAGSGPSQSSEAIPTNRNGNVDGSDEAAGAETAGDETAGEETIEGENTGNKAAGKENTEGKTAGNEVSEGEGSEGEITENPTAPPGEAAGSEAGTTGEAR